MRSTIKVWLAAATLCGLLSGCGMVVREGEGHPPAAAETTAHYPVTIETLDSKAERVSETFAEPPRRVVAIWQNSIETLCALGVGDRIVAAMGLPSGEYLRPAYREVYSRVPYTSMESLDVETVLMQEPDLIVGWQSSFTSKTLRDTAFWNSRGIATYISPGSSAAVSFHTIDYEYEDILNMGRIFDREREAEAIVSDMRRAIGRAKDAAARTGRHPRGLILEYLGNNVRVYGERTLAGNILREMGGELLAATEQTISKEQLIELDPDALFLIECERDYGGEELLLSRIYEEKAFRELSCVKERRVYVLPLYAVYSAGVRAQDGIEIIGKGLYPEGI